MASVFTYPKLVDSTRDIRLLTLQAGKHNDPLSCSLCCKELKRDLRYEALSYVWGPKEPGRMIMVNGQAFKITLNLNAALLRLRLPDSNRTLWVDAICIDQADDQERGRQIGLMRKIYSWTDCAILWLGEEPEFSEPAIGKDLTIQLQQLLDASDALLESTLGLLRTSDEVINSSSELLAPTERNDNVTTYANLEGIFMPEKAGSNLPPDTFAISKTAPADWTDNEFYLEGHRDLRAQPHMACDSIFHAFCLFRDLSVDQCLHRIDYLQKEADGKHTHITNARRAAHWLLQRPWWNRIWTVQESVLPIVSVLYYGPVRAPLSMLLNATTRFQRHRATCCAGVPDIGDMLNIMTKTCAELGRIRLDHLVNDKLDLCTLLRTFRARDASDKRDKVYALLPLCGESEDSPLRLTPEYQESNTSGEVFIDTTIALLEMTQNLDVLSQPSHVQKSESIPSWVADYSVQAVSAGTASWYYRQMSMYNAGSQRYACAKVIDRRVLTVDGVLIDTMDVVCPGMFYNTEQASGDVLREWYAMVEKVADEKENPQDWSNAFWKVICGDCVPPGSGSGHNQDFRRMEDDDMLIPDTFDGPSLLGWAVPEKWTQLGPSTLITTRAGAHADVIKASTHGRKFFITKHGHMGLGPFYSGLQYPRREQIFVCAGGKVPLVFKEAGEKEIPGVGKVRTHELMGDCYLHGFMDGEAMEDFDQKKQKLYVV